MNDAREPLFHFLPTADVTRVDIIRTADGAVVGSVQVYDSDGGNPPPWRTAETWRWRFQIEGGNSGGGYMPREESSSTPARG